MCVHLFHSTMPLLPISLIEPSVFSFMIYYIFRLVDTFQPMDCLVKSTTTDVDVPLPMSVILLYVCVCECVCVLAQANQPIISRCNVVALVLSNSSSLSFSMFLSAPSPLSFVAIHSIGGFYTTRSVPFTLQCIHFFVDWCRFGSAYL